MDNIFWIKDLDKNKVKEAGVKGAYLGELFNADFLVPNGFVISTSAMSDFFYGNNLQDKINNLLKNVNLDDYQNVIETSKAIQNTILNENIASTLQNDILEAYEDLNVSSELRAAKLDVLNLIKSGRGNAIVSVRGSVNSDNLSFAGQQDSFLNIVGGKKLIEAMKKCWASLYSPRAIYYIKTHNINNILSGVVVQKMIDSNKSGTIFTVNPINNNRDEILIEAGIGLGKSISDGSVRPDMYIVDKNTNDIKTKIINRQKTKVIRDVNNNDTVKKKVYDDEHRETLSKGDVHELAKIALDIENHYGKPMNIEFGIDKRAYILQARGITTLNNEIRILDIAGDVILNGQGVSSGLGVGKVRVVRNNNSEFENGDVLVAEFLDVDLLPFIKRSNGVVVNEGGSLSNGGIICRELEVPLVINENATMELRNGLIVTVDGFNGRVFRGEARNKVDIIE